MTTRLDLLLVCDETVDEAHNRYKGLGAGYSSLIRHGALPVHELESILSVEGLSPDEFVRPLSFVLPTLDIQPRPDDAGHGIIAHFHRPSLALCDLATVARQHGYSVRIVDNAFRFPFRWKQIEEIC